MKGDVTMNEYQLQQCVTDIATQAIPEEVDLVPQILAAIDRRRPFVTTLAPHHWGRPLPILLGLALLLSILCAGVILTPWGRAYAGQLFQFFAIAPGVNYAVPTEDLGYYQSTALPEITASETTGGIQPGCTLPENAMAVACQFSRAEADAGFLIKVPNGEIDGLEFVGASGSSQMPTVVIEYASADGGSHLVITESSSPDAIAKWEAIPDLAQVDLVSVGTSAGEFVQGGFVVLPGKATAQWTTEVPEQRLRWRDGFIAYEIHLLGQTAPVEWLDKAAMIDLASSMRPIADLSGPTP